VIDHEWMTPDVYQLTIFPADQIARQLGKLCRFAGATPDHWSVARHSLLVAALAPDDPWHRMAALLHDAHECWTGDILRPVTRLLSPFARGEVSDIQRDIDLHLYSLIGFEPSIAVLNAVNTADDTACRLEMQLLGKSSSEITDALPNLQEAAWQLAFHGNAQIDAMHWLVSFKETLKDLEAIR
jgi:hypothetical protein